MKDGRNRWPMLHDAAVSSAVVAGTFSIIVSVLLAWNHLGLSAAPLQDSPELDRLKASLQEHPQDVKVKERIRELDLELRREFFWRKGFSHRGAWLLAGGVAVLLIGLKAAVACRTGRPRPGAPEDANAARRRLGRRARWGICGLGAILGGSALVWALVSSGNFEAVNAALTGKGSPPPPAVPAVLAPYVPTSEEIARNWPRFRGPGGSATSAYGNVPTSWNAKTGQGIRWKSPIPLAGHSSPVVWSDRIFLTGAKRRQREVYCYSTETGQLLWQRRVVVPGPQVVPEVSAETGHAASTGATDGRYFCAIFANGDVACVDFDGHQVWAKNLGQPDNHYGHASSLTIHEGKLIVQFDQAYVEDGKSKLIAFSAASGDMLWQTSRAVSGSWASPIMVQTPGGKEIIAAADPWLIAYDPDDGDEIWQAKVLSGEIAPSPVGGAGMVFATNEGAHLVAVRTDGVGDVTESHVAWKVEHDQPDICSPLTDGELLWTLTSSGFLVCYDVTNGSRVWEKDFEVSFSASPSLAGGSVYLLAENGDMYIIAAAREYKLLGKAELGENAYASPAFLDGRIYIRGRKNLYCIGN